MSTSDAKEFVLVHGTSHGGWCWKRVVHLLHLAGHRVYTPTLTGCGERSHLINSGINLDTHITDVVNVIKWEELAEVVLCGHSYGGWVISGVVEQLPKRINSIIFLDAFMPEDGQRGFDLQSSESQKAVLRAKESGHFSRPPGAIERYKLNARDKKWVESMLTPQPIGVSLQPIKLTGARERVKNKAYILATKYNNPPFVDCYSKLKDNPLWQVYALHCGHNVMLDMPKELTELLLEVAKA